MTRGVTASASRDSLPYLTRLAFEIMHAEYASELTKLLGMIAAQGRRIVELESAIAERTDDGK